MMILIYPFSHEGEGLKIITVLTFRRHNAYP